ncbi:MAG: hypothetical protein AVDCRST_MAG74-3123 [uncultured Pyrinomonadaceae bacterium]|uniref:VCBS repeat-containing protein n=1 Tax=uncultured Pyrinomonadaceae bacterium TaxID=2283094 RepID=A0A6J4PUV3_9BACT|nr:MAG: hypothetical protein AVDCRST_MAG74-3123 [uncultured Pyrinomonadaceae bacterium]
MNQRRFTKSVISSFCLYALVMMQIVFASATNTSAAAQTADSPAVIIYDNGPFQTGATSKSGVAAPAGAQFSEVQNFAGDTSNANTNAGYGCATTATAENRCADNFVIPVGETWTINQVIVHGYQTGFAGTTSPFISATLQIWNGPPGVAGSTVIFGDTTTNRLATSTDTNSFRIFNSVAPPPGSVPGTTRRIWQNNLNVSPGLVLTTGEYWIDFSLNAGAAGNFTPSTTIVNTRYTPLMRARQRTGAAPGVWADIIDAATPATAVDVPQDFPFKLDGTRTGMRAVPYSRKVDITGDNLTDYTLTRNSGTTKTWFTIPNPTGAPSGVQFGNATDTNVPEDYDGDGRTDIAVWRPGALAYFYILQSSTNTVRIEQFGQTGDDPTIIGDYDGDGRADPAVYRPGTGGSSSFFYYRASTATGGGNITGIPFGIAGDKPYPGDFDGDRRYDASVVRNNGGNAQIFQRRSTQGFFVTNYGLFSDRFVTADYDGDSRNDLVVIRDNGGALTWYVSTSVTNQFVALNYGTTASDTPAPGDYDGDSRTDFGVYRGGFFFTFGTLSAPRAIPFGQTGDTPAAAYLVH